MKQPFVGRSEVLGRIHERYRKAQCGDGGLVLLRGDAGIGKSRLIEEFLDGVRASDPNIVTTAAFDYAASPFAPMVTVVETWLQQRPALFTVAPGLRAAVDVILAADAQAVLPSAAERLRGFEGMAQLCRIAAADAPTTIVIDDLHYADAAAVQLLAHVLAATRRSAFFVLAATRPEYPAERSVLSPISRLERLGNATTLRVDALCADASEALITSASDGRLGREARARILERAEGNPLFAEELVRQGLATGRDAVNGIPATIFETVLERFSLLSDRGRGTLRLASVLGRDFDCSLLARIEGCERSEVLPTLRHAVALGLVDETDDPDIFRFHHAMTREAIAGELLKAERHELHRRVFRDLRQQPQRVEDVTALAFHAYESGDRETTAQYNELAGDQAAGNQAFESAVVHYERAFAACAENDPHTARVCQKLATAYLLSGFPDRAVAPVQLALAHYRRCGAVADIADALLLLADIAGQAGEDERRLELLAETYDVLAGSTEPALQAKGWLCAFEIAIAERDVDGLIDRCAELASSATIDAPLAIALRNASAHALLMQRRYQAAIEAQGHAVALATASGNVELLATSRFQFGTILALSGQIAPAGTSFGEAAAIARSRCATTESALGTVFQAEMVLMNGNVTRARELVESSIDDARRSDHPTLIAMMGRVGIFAGLRSDDLAFVRRVVSALDLETLFRDRTPERFFLLSGAFAQFLVTDDRLVEARRILGRAVRRLSIKRLRSTDWSPCTMLTIAALGDDADIPTARRPITDWFTPFAPAFVHLFDALVAERYGNAVDAARHAEQAIPLFHAHEMPFEEATALSMAGRKREALALFEHIGARGAVDRLRDELTPKNRQGRAANALTPREREVAALVADGLTNREIADRLCVSEKTTETHLASIFLKLGARSRNEIEPELLRMPVG